MLNDLIEDSQALGKMKSPLGRRGWAGIFFFVLGQWFPAVVVGSIFGSTRQ
jgi:hypothetical protein